MDENTKKKILFIRDLIKKEKFVEALEEAEIMTYKCPKVYQYYLMAGLCADKLNNVAKAQQFYKNALDIKSDEPNALKALFDLYTKMGKPQLSMKYMEQMLKQLKKSDVLKYRQNLVKLVEMHYKNQDMQKIDKIFKQLLVQEKQITQQLAAIAEFYFKTAVTNQCFNLNIFLELGVRGDNFRTLLPNAKQKINFLMVQIVRYLYSMRIKWNIEIKDVSENIYSLKQYYPDSSAFLMLFLLDDYIISQTNYNTVVLEEILLFLSAFFDKTQNCYLNLETLQPECFVVSAILSYQFLAFMKQFFSLDQSFNKYFDRLQALVPELEQRKVREEYSCRIRTFILKQCRLANHICENQNIQTKLEQLKYRISKLDGSYLEQVIAKMAMNCFINYQKLSDMKNLLKIRINNLKEGEIQPHLYKYYYDYLIKIAKLYKSLDQNPGIYDVIKYIFTYEPYDQKYFIQYHWMEIGRHSKLSHQQFKNVVLNSLANIDYLLPTLNGQLQSQALRKKALLKIILKENEHVLDGFKLALGIQRSFQNLLCIGFYYFIQKQFERSLRYLKQAFIIKQDDYHLNRAIYVSLIKNKDLQQAYSFLDRIYEGFPNVYWVNYGLAISSINNKRIELAYKYLSGALQSFIGGVNKSFKYSYTKTIEGEKYSLLYLIDQNAFHLLYDHIVIPDAFIQQIFPIASQNYFFCEQKLKQARLETQLGQILKLLGRNKSSLNHLHSANWMLSQLPIETQKSHPLQLISTKKQYGTILFYVRAYKESQSILKDALKICEQLENSPSINKTLLADYQSQIHSLIFEVSVMRLDEMQKFESYESVQQYIAKFNDQLKQMKQLMKRPSLNYYKAKYQFYILCYLHDKNYGVQKSIETIKQFLVYFRLEISEITSDRFYNRLVQLSREEKIIVKECLEDYCVLLYMKQTSNLISQPIITSQEILPFLQLFPMSNVLYIVYGMLVKETKLKISAFLKCIQLDKESPISVDLLASLFLKEKDYITACKLFLKSLEIDLFNTKSYIGLCTCLFVLIGASVKRGQPEDKNIIRKALNKINSYMEFLRITDPSENYHLLKFLKTMLSDEPIPLFELKAGLEQSRKLTSHKYSEKLVFKLLENSSQYLKQFNIWKSEGQQQIFKKYIENNNIDTKEDLYEMGKTLLTNLQKQIIESNLEQRKSGQVRIKLKCRFLNKLSVVAHIFSKSRRLDQSEICYFLQICSMLQEQESAKDNQLLKLQIYCKDIFLLAYVKSSSAQEKNPKQVLADIKEINNFKMFKGTPTFSHIQAYLDYYSLQEHLIPLKKYIFGQIHIHPTDKNLRKILFGWLLVVQKQTSKSYKKVKDSIDYRLESASQLNQASLDENQQKISRLHKKNVLLYNYGQPNAFVGYISEQWKKTKQTKWIQLLNKILKMYEGKQNRLSKNSRNKAEALILEMSSERIKNNQKLEYSGMEEDKKTRIKSLGELFRSYQQENSLKIQKKIIQQSASNLKFVMKHFISHIVKKYQHSAEIQGLIDECIERNQDSKDKGYYYLLKFISLCSKSPSNQEELIQFLQKLASIIENCQCSSEVNVHPHSIIIMKCIFAFLSLNFAQLESELETAFNSQLIDYSDKLVFNYFQIMRVYRQVELNHQGENVFETFTQYIKCIVEFAKQPYWKGFFYALKAMGDAIAGEENVEKLSRQLKYAILLSPNEGKSLMMSK